MTKEEYIAEWIEIEASEKSLKERRLKLNADFIAEHRRYNDGDKVILITNERMWLGKLIPEQRTCAYVESASVYKGKISYQFLKAKKDGSKSLHSLHVYAVDRIELLEPAKP